MQSKSAKSNGAWIANRRKFLGLLQPQLAAHAGICAATLSRLENGGPVSPATRRAVALALADLDANPPLSPAASLSPSSYRMRRHRARRQAALHCINIELRASEIRALLARAGHEVGGVTRHDEKDVRAALYAFLDRTLRP
jgi:transcriptional regulator with XRE-family HTH domain